MYIDTVGARWASVAGAGGCGSAPGWRVGMSCTDITRRGARLCLVGTRAAHSARAVSARPPGVARAVRQGRALQSTYASKELEIPAKAPYLSAKAYVSKGPAKSAKEPYTSTEEAYVSAKEPYISANVHIWRQRTRYPQKEPYISSVEPYISAKRALFICNRALYIRKGAIRIRKGALDLRKCTYLQTKTLYP